MSTKVKNLVLAVFVAAVVLFFAVTTFAAGLHPHTVKSHQVNEDDTYVYYSDTLSDKTEKTRKVKKPKPRVYPQSVKLVATNDFPVQVQYVYVELYADQSVKTNYQYRTKTQRERAVITMPPMPEIQKKPRGKLDAFGHAVKRSKEERAMERIRTGPITDREELKDLFIFTFENGEKKTHLKKEMTETFIKRAQAEIKKTIPVQITEKKMRKVDIVVSQRVEGNQIIYELQSGKSETHPIKKAYTARVQSAPVYDPDDFIFHPDGDFCAIGCKPANTNKTKEAIHGKTRAR